MRQVTEIVASRKPSFTKKSQFQELVKVKRTSDGRKESETMGVQMWGFPATEKARIKKGGKILSNQGASRRREDQKARDWSNFLRAQKKSGREPRTY